MKNIDAILDNDEKEEDKNELNDSERDELFNQFLTSIEENLNPNNDFKIIINGVEDKDLKTNKEEILSSLGLKNLADSQSKECKFRDNEIFQILSILLTDKPFPVLIGPNGVGKTKIVEHIAYLFKTSKDIPLKLRNKQIWELQFDSFMSDTSLAGQLEEKISILIKTVSDSDIILYIDELHLIADDDPQYRKVGELLKSILSRNKIKVIGSTTTQEFKKINDGALTRRFQKVIVPEMTKEQTIEILKDRKLNKKYNISIPNELFEFTVNLAERHKFKNQHMPDNCITFLDRALADLSILPYKTKKVEKIKIKPIRSLRKMHLKKTMNLMIKGTSTIPDDDSEALSHIKGQDEQLKTIVSEIKRYVMYNLDDKPLSFIFAGKSGTGKTETAKALAQMFYNNKPIIINMTEYQSPSSETKLFGSHDGYIGSNSKREKPLDILESNPYQVILLDEFEKAHPSIQQLFMRALDEGQLEDSKGNTIDFKKSIIIATTNAGFTNKKANVGFVKGKLKDEKEAISLLSKLYKEEVLNRFTKVITFDDISVETYIEIAKETYKNDIKKISVLSSTSLPKEMTEEMIKELEKSYIPSFNARPIKKKVRELIFNLIDEIES